MEKALKALSQLILLQQKNFMVNIKNLIPNISKHFTICSSQKILLQILKAKKTDSSGRRETLFGLVFEYLQNAMLC